MCIIAIKPQGAPMFPEKMIRTMFSRNGDGAGIMWTENNMVHIKKGFMKVEDLLEFLNGRSDWENIPAVAHFRIGTAGLNDQLNCHPYPVREKNQTECECELAMVHNGILHDFNPPRGSKINDTQVFLHTVIDRLPKTFLGNRGIRRLIEESIGSSKLAFLDRKGKITTFGRFIEDEGYSFSNESYKSYEKSFYGSCGYGTYGTCGTYARQATLFAPAEFKAESILFPRKEFLLDDENYGTCYIPKVEVPEVEQTLDHNAALLGDSDGCLEYEFEDGHYYLEKYDDGNQGALLTFMPGTDEE